LWVAVVAYGVGVASGIRIHMGVVALDEKAAAVEREATRIADAQEAADIIEEATDETAAVIKKRVELSNAISKYRKEEARRSKLINVPLSCPTVTCIDSLFVETWNGLAAGTEEFNGKLRSSEPSSE
jgi:hypothetical protein